MVVEYRFVGTDPEVNLSVRMQKGGLAAIVDEGDESSAVVSVHEDDVWANEAAWVEAVEAHYSCVFDGTPD